MSEFRPRIGPLILFDSLLSSAVAVVLNPTYSSTVNKKRLLAVLTDLDPSVVLRENVWVIGLLLEIRRQIRLHSCQRQVKVI
jgi:hypothetical protein